jgi:hypothetical protein
VGTCPWSTWANLQAGASPARATLIIGGGLQPTQFEFFTRNDHRPRTIVPERDLQQSRGHGCEIGREGECTTVTNPVD